MMRRLLGGFQSGGIRMRLPFLVVVLSLAACFAALPSQAQNAFTPDQVKWGPAPPFVPPGAQIAVVEGDPMAAPVPIDRKSTRLNSSHSQISYAVFCLKKKKHDKSNETLASEPIKYT